MALRARQASRRSSYNRKNGKVNNYRELPKLRTKKVFRNGRHEVAFGFDEPGKVKDSYFVNEKEESHEQSGADEPVHQPLDGVGRRRAFGGGLSHSAKDGVEPAP